MKKKEYHNFDVTSLCGHKLKKRIHRQSVLEEVAIHGMYYQEKVRETWWASLLLELGCMHAWLRVDWLRWRLITSRAAGRHRHPCMRRPVDNFACGFSS